MISIIICSKNKEISSSLANNIQDTVGCEYELIVIDNSENQYSIFSAYNTGITKSKFPYLCFVHDDVEFITKNWGKKVTDYLNKPDNGFIGVAGGRAILRVPYDWSSYYPLCNITHSHFDSVNNLIDKKKIKPKNHDTSSEFCLILDGVFLCARKTIFEKIQFDENLVGFHCYDVDICMQTIQAGFRNRVVYDIDLKHFSRGSYDKNYIDALFNFHNKWNHILPVFDQSVDKETKNKILYKTEKKTINRLRKRMIRTGMNINEIIPVIKKYVLLTGKNIDKFLLFILKPELHLFRFISILRKKMIYQKRKK